MPKPTDAEKERLAAERAEQRAAEAKAKRDAAENEVHAGIIAKLDERGAHQDAYNIFNYIHKMVLQGRLPVDSEIRRIHIRQEGLR
jgi:hypothetical protein